MLSYQQIKDKPAEHLALTGLTQSEFAALVIPFEQAWLADQAKRAGQGQERQRQPGGGRKPNLLKLEDKLLFILFYFKTYPLQTVLGVIFGFSQGQANEWIHRLSPILKAALGQEVCLPERDPHNLEQVLSQHDVLEFIIDGTERRRQRPVATAKQKEHYSGKKKRILTRTI